ncbi:MAG: ribosome-associated translation inhibitor RaiA [Alphaproteobacteria bacterium]|nr:ribosome-associated translation inhibitor RaiA [Alphaproteobacteria bacterium]MBV9371755.1 ribosome-associated translation inhibitor RaiA [Alphaproteobacteria bacterium]MBV9900705.1 ribosome-associated translation inhibitor RaiA [Alphaproteobacteria bacterium]
MDIRVSGHQVETGEALRGHVDARLRGADRKYSARLVSSQVTFGKGPHDHGFTVEIVAYAPQGAVLKATERGAEARSAFDAAAEKVEKQMRRLMRKVKDRRAGDPAELLETVGDAEYRRGEDASGPDEG